MLNIVGDINLTDAAFDTGIGVGSKMKDGKDPFEKINRANDDLWIGNFEGVCSDVTDAQGMEAQQFNIPPKYLNHFTHMNFYNMANNHIMEHGAKAFCETAKNLSSFGAKAFGLNNQKSVIFEHCDHKYSISGFCQRKENSVYSPLYWYNPDIQDIKKEFDTLPLDAFKIIYIHWGVEFMDRPTNDQQIFAHALIDMGFDLVIGMHPHLLQGFEDYKGKRIYYSIGNFVFNMGWEPLNYGAIIHIDNNNVVSHSYVHIEKDYFPIVVPENNVPQQFRFSYLNELIRFDMNLEEYSAMLRKRTKLYHSNNRKYILRQLASMKPIDSFSILTNFIKRRF